MRKLVTIQPPKSSLSFIFPFSNTAGMALETYRDALSISPTEDGRLPPITPSSNLPKPEDPEAPAPLPPISTMTSNYLWIKPP